MKKQKNKLNPRFCLAKNSAFEYSAMCLARTFPVQLFSTFACPALSFPLTRKYSTNVEFLLHPRGADPDEGSYDVALKASGI